MRIIFEIMKKEWLRWWSMPIFYILYGICIFCTGFYTWFFKGQILNDLNIIKAIFQALYWFLAIAIPLLATGTILEERRLKTLETLFAKPISFTQFTLGKLAAINGVMLSFIVLTLGYFFSLEQISAIPYKYLLLMYFFLLLTGNIYALISMAIASFGNLYWKSYLWSYLIVFSIHFIFSLLGDISTGGIQNFFYYLGLHSQFHYCLQGLFALSTLVYQSSIIIISFFIIIYKLSRDNV